MDNYRTVNQLVNEALRKFHKIMNDYLENILNAPSTINRILKYYAIGFQEGNYNKRYIMFKGMIVIEYELVMPEYVLDVIANK